MAKTSSLGIRGRLLLGFGAILFILVLAIGAVLTKITSAKHSAEEVTHNYLPTYAAYLDLNGQLYQSKSTLNSWLLTGDPALKRDFAFAWSNIDRAMGILNHYSSTWDPAYQQKWQEIVPLIEQLKIAEIKAENTQNPALAKPMLLTEIIPLSNKILDRLDGPLQANGDRVGGLYDIQYQLFENGIQDILSNMLSIQIIEYISLIIGLSVSLLISFYTIKSISRYITLFREQSNRIATGDLTQRIVINSTDEMGQLGRDLNTMTDSLATITKQITEACQNMVSTIEEVNHSVNAQSAGASEQASSINEITASLEEIEKSSIQTMEKATALGESAEHTQEQGQLGLEAVEQSINGMKAARDKVQAIAQTILDLSNQTQQVGEITAVVTGLAQQLKMLALNASIEAAKAGEVGKGFAVVAAEVKNLAEQSEQSTTQVQKILEDIRHATEKAVIATEEGTKGVDHGTELVEKMGHIVRDLSEVIHQTMVATKQIEAAVRQEGIGIEQITTGMTEIHQVTTASVEGVKQTTIAIENLVKIAKNLKKYIDMYKI